MYEFPFGAGQQLNLNWIINEIITIHKQLDPDYELPNFDTAFPYMNLNTLNLDWILRELKAIKDLAPTEDATLLKMVANALLAETYDATTQYDVDDIVYRDNEKRLFKCITTTPAGGEAWDSSKWVEVDVGGVLTDLLNSVVIPPEPYDSNPAMDGTASAGTSTQYARGDHVHPKDTARVPTSRTVNGKALSSNITLNASDIPNDSNVTGDNVDDALNNLNVALTNILQDQLPAFAINDVDYLSTICTYSLYHCEGSLVAGLQGKIVDNKYLYVCGRVRISITTRTGSNPGVTWTLPNGLKINGSAAVQIGTSDYSDSARYGEASQIILINDSSSFTISATESFSNVADGKTLALFLPPIVIKLK